MSNKLVKKNRFENITFTELGLDEDFNFLEAPCCGCGNKMTLEIPPVYGDITVDMLSVQFVEKVLKLVKSGNYTLQLEE